MCTDNCSKKTSNRDKNKSTGYAHGYTYQDQKSLKFLQNTQNDSNSYHRTHRASLLLHRTEQPPKISAYYYKNNVFFTKTFLPKELATDHTINTCILVKFLKLQRAPSSNKRGKYYTIFPIINKRYLPTVPRHRHRYYNHYKKLSKPKQNYHSILQKLQ